MTKEQTNPTLKTKFVNNEELILIACPNDFNGTICYKIINTHRPESSKKGSTSLDDVIEEFDNKEEAIKFFEELI